MAVLLSAQGVSKSFGTRTLFRNITLNLHEGEHVGLIGPNGAGKSTLLAILAGEEPLDGGTVSLQRQLRLGYVPQIESFNPEQPVFALVLERLAEAALDEHERELCARRILTQCGFETSRQQAPFGSLSGGWRKRVALARELALEPALLLLDEPTNHLDLEGILWLENMLRNAPFGFLLVSHDRYFLEHATQRVVELNGCYPQGFFSVSGNLSEFLIQREQFLEGQLQTQRALASQVRREVEWLRRGPPARTTKSRARCDEAGRLIDELAAVTERNSQNAAVKIEFVSSQRQANKLLVLDKVSKKMGERTLLSQFSLVLSAGQKIGLLGPNGCGKTTLLRILFGELPPDTGTVTRAECLKIVYFDQHREQLDPDAPLRRALAPSGDLVAFRGQVLHVSGWAKRFLFRSEQLDMPVRALSGGEQARVQIARLMLQPADVLLLDEPTNDLDIPSLEVLEESLVDFPGAVVVVTHDRLMLQRLEADLLALDGSGQVRSFTSYNHWLEVYEEEQKQKQRKAEPKPAARPQTSKNTKRLTYKEQQEWAGMEATIVEHEAQAAALQQQLEDPALTSDTRKLQEHCKALAAAQEAVERLYQRWQDLEAKQR
jgi:ATP-binding cassette subfamily F protein uup